MSKKQRLHALLVNVEAAEQPWTLIRRPTLGLYYLAQHATDCGFEVKVDFLSANDNVVRRLVRLLRRHECRLLGFCVDHGNQWALRHIVAGVKLALPDCEVVLGATAHRSARGNAGTYSPSPMRRRRRGRGDLR